MLIVVTNQSKRVTDLDVSLMTQAVQKQLTLHVSPAWNQRTPTISFYPANKKIPNYAWIVKVLDTPDVANALGYHDQTNDIVDAFIFVSPVLDNGGVILYDAKNPQNVSVSSVLSHEICEMFIDRFANFWADGPNSTEYALELCDPVESDSYAISVGGIEVSLSNFIFPAWFNTQAKAPANLPFDYLKKLIKPFTMTSGGYMILRKNGKETQVFGEDMPQWKKELKMSDFYRRVPKALGLFTKIWNFIKRVF